MLKGLVTSLFEHGKIETTLPKAKEVVPLAETLITKAKNGTLHDRRQILASVSTTAIAHKLVDEIAPQLKGRTSGHLRITRTRLRVGDNTQLAEVSFVDALTAPAAPVAEEKPAEKKAPAKAAKTEEAKA